MKRKIISIDEEKCTGCGLCIPDCPEGALQILEGKARLVSDLFCDGLGACIGICPEGAIEIIEREAGAYDEKAVMNKIVRQGDPVITAHLEHLISHGETHLYREAIEYLRDHHIPVPPHRQATENHERIGKGIEHDEGHLGTHPFAGCPGSAARSIQRDNHTVHKQSVSELRQWPVQLRLLNPRSQYFDGADLLIAADCVPFAYADFHADFLRGKVVIIFCPKLDADIDEYVSKLAEILSLHTIHTITVLHMEVPCCSGVRYVLDRAMVQSGKKIPVQEFTITIEGQVKSNTS